MAPAKAKATVDDEPTLRRYRVLANVENLHHGETVMIDPTHRHWAPFIDAGYLEPEDPEPADLVPLVDVAPAADPPKSDDKPAGDGGQSDQGGTAGAETSSAAA